MSGKLDHRNLLTRIRTDRLPNPGEKGAIMAFAKQDLTGVNAVQWSILIHFITVGLVFAGLLIHIYMAAIAKGELPALISMFTGKVPADYAKHHHRFWFEEVTPQEPEPDPSSR